MILKKIIKKYPKESLLNDKSNLINFISRKTVNIIKTI